MASTLNESNRLKAILSFNRADKDDNKQDKKANVENSLKNLKVSFGKDTLTESTWNEIEKNLRQYKKGGIIYNEFEKVYANTLNKVNTQEAEIKTLFDKIDVLDGVDGAIRNPLNYHKALKEVPAYNKLTEQQKMAVHDLCKLLHYDALDGINLEEFTAIVRICNNSVGQGDRLVGKLYMRTLFKALEADEARHSNSTSNGVFENGNTLWGKLQDYSSLKSTVSVDTWYSEDLYAQINLRKPEGITDKEFNEIYNVYANDVPKDESKKVKKRKSIQTIFNKTDELDGVDGAIRNPLNYHKALKEVPAYNKLTEQQKMAVHDLCKLLHYDALDGINLEEFTAIVGICNASVGQGDRLVGELYMRTLFKALEADEARHSNSTSNGVFENGNTLWGKLQDYSSLKSTVSAETWYSEDLYAQINLRKPEGITDKEFNEIYNMYAAGRV